MTRIVPNGAILLPDNASCVFRGEIFDVYQWPQRLFDGSTATFEMLKRPDTVLILAIKDDKIIFIREQQPGRPEYTRLPGGRVDAGEDWQVAAARESAEELGLSFENWHLVDVQQPIAKIEWFVVTFVATRFIKEQTPQPDAGEKIVIVPMEFAAAKAYVASTADPLNDYTRELFENANSLADLKALPQFKGKTIA
jgi:ADP-ribose pyrophosphatase